MKIYFNNLFNDYIFEFDGMTWLMVHTSSLHPNLVEWWPLPIDSKRLQLIAVVE